MMSASIRPICHVCGKRTQVGSTHDLEGRPVHCKCLPKEESHSPEQLLAVLYAFVEHGENADILDACQNPQNYLPIHCRIQDRKAELDAARLRIAELETEVTSLNQKPCGCCGVVHT